MVPKYFPSITTSITPLISHATCLHAKIPLANSIHHPWKASSKSANLSGHGFKRTRRLRQTRLSTTLASKGPNDGDNRAVETVLRLYEAIKKKNLNELSEIIGDECLCVCSFVKLLKTFRGKKQVMEFFSSLMGNLGDKFEFVVQPTLQHGMTVGVSWRLECSKTHKPLGTGFSFHTCHTYQGKVLIRNVEMFLEHIQPSKLKMVGIVMSIVGQMASQALIKGDKKRAACVLCCLIVFAMLFFVVRWYRS